MLYSLTPVEGFDLSGIVKEHIYLGTAQKAIVTLSNGNEIRIERLAGEPLPSDGYVYLYWKNEDAKLIHTFDNVFARAMDNAVFQ